MHKSSSKSHPTPRDLDAFVHSSYRKMANGVGFSDPVTNRLVCARLNRSACLSESLTGSILISCASSTLAEVRSCNIE